jgi:y4mF family transcriptional regulator
MSSRFDEDSVAGLVRSLRQQQRLTQRQLAVRAGVGPRAVWDLERGKPTIRLDVVNRVLAVFGRRVTVADAPVHSGAW